MQISESRTVVIAIFLALSNLVGCQENSHNGPDQLANPDADFVAHELFIRQELVNDAPIGPGVTQPSDHCPSGPGNWFAGSGRSTGTSNVFGDLRQTEVYCVNVDRSEPSGGIATWTDTNGDTIEMSFGAKLLTGFAYSVAPNAPMIGFAQFNGGTGKWAGISGDAVITGKQNGDGTASLIYQGMIYLPQ